MSGFLDKITFTIPVYNDARYIEQSVLSVLAQGAQVVIYDNASTDGTSDICARLAAEHPRLTHVRHPENIGAFENFKRAMEGCETEYFSWVGSHDLLGEGYALALIHALDAAPEAVLAAATVVQIDESGADMRQDTESHWATASKNLSPLHRAGACAAGLRKDCSIFYGVYRLSKLKKIWFDQPCLGFDRIILVRAAAEGPVLYVPEVKFFARNLDKTRNAKTDRDRRAEVVGAKPIQKNVFLRNYMMAQTILQQAQTPEDLTAAFEYIAMINRRYQQRRYFQKQRWVRLVIVLGVVAAFVLALLLR